MKDGQPNSMAKIKMEEVKLFKYLRSPKCPPKLISV